MKLKRGQKICKKCNAICAARSRICKECGAAFISKNTPIKNEVKDWKSLEKGDWLKVVQGTGRALSGASRVAKQVTPRALGLGSQSPESRTSVPVVTPPAINFEPPAPRKTGPAAPLSPIEQIRRNAQQMTLRERAAQNPAAAATLLGGLGSAGLL